MEKELKMILDVDISEDMMNAALCLKPVTPEDEQLLVLEEIIKILTREGIVVGIDSALINEMITQKVYNEYIIVARGVEVTEGYDGYYDFKFEQNPSKKPKLLENGCVDYYNLHLINSVEVGTLLAEYIPKNDGANGITIKGQVKYPKKTRDLPPLRGQGFTVNEENQYFAAIAGKVELNMGQLQVWPICTITGDVDLATGNVEFKGDLEILGTIKAGMTVKATGNITVNKRVEAATVSAGKELLIRGGILGGGKADISAIGNVFAQFIENATVSSGGSIQADSIVNSNITAYSDVNIFGKTSTIVGGTLKANRRVRTKYLGSETCVKTVIEVGIDEGVNTTLKDLYAELQEDEKELDKIERTLELYKTRKPDDPKLYMQLVRTKIEKTTEIQRLRSLYDQINKRVEVGKYAEVVVEKRVYPGVRLIIDGKPSVIENEYEEIVFKRKGDKILTKRYTDEDYDD